MMGLLAACSSSRILWGAPNQKTRSLPAAALRVLFFPLLMKASFQRSGKNKTRFLTETGFFGLGE